MPNPGRNKHPDATLDYVIDWSYWLNGDTITAAAWTVPAGITSVSTSFTASTATIFLAGGSDGQRFTLNCKITTLAGRVNDFSFDVVLTLAPLPNA